MDSKTFALAEALWDSLVAIFDGLGRNGEVCNLNAALSERSLVSIQQIKTSEKC